MADVPSFVGNSSIWSLVPDSCQSRVDSSKATEEGADRFYRRWSSFVQSLMVDSTPGIVLGSISAAGFTLFCLWMCVYFRRRKIIRRARRDRKAQRAEAKQVQQAQQAQFMTVGDDGKPANAAPEAGSTGWRGRLAQWWQEFTAGQALKWCMVLMAAAVVGVSAWGLAESITATNDLISDFWQIVDGVYNLVAELNASLQQLGTSLGGAAKTLTDVQGALQTVVNTVQGVPIVGPILGNALPMDKINGFLGGTATDAIGALNNASALVLNDIVPVVNNTVLPVIESLKDNNEAWSLDVQNKWRYVVIAVLFGLLILLSIAVAAACFWMKWGLSATFLVACLWALNAVVMFLGMGMLNGAKGVANDACLYGEETVIRLLNESVQGDTGAKVQSALRYYREHCDAGEGCGNPLLTNATDQCNPELTAALLRQFADIEIHSTLVTVWDLADQLPSIANLLNGIKLPTIPLVNFDLNTITRPIAEGADSLQGLLEDVCNTTLLLVRENRVWPIYVGIKSYVCCDLTNSIHDVYVPWVTAGSLTLVLCLLASVRVITATVKPVGRSGGAPQDGAETGGKAAQFADSAAGAGKGSAPPDVTAQEPFAVLGS
ncbi:hypothetical protein COHA_003654 [Chlorella ohadii]|uniref:Uncharacterized protein n=1 Tax=Chlorella ohadii TaxID=2649997 RepID=A0AAD5DUM5_9CHLO|nr:hypothetical protein COHA_003654 [Chlorella ohadii]